MQGMLMNGLRLSERYYKFYGKPMFEKLFPDYINRMAIGLVGKGSECLGFDDVISMDHDWGPGFCIWLNEQDYADIGKELHAAYYTLPADFAGVSFRIKTNDAANRFGVFEINTFYESFIGLREPPVTWDEWIGISETKLATCTNGKIFFDELGEFSHFRNKLLDFYPSEVRLKKIADRCFVISREGQYNFMRCVGRKEFVAARLAESRFVESVISLIFLLNWHYIPYYKWMHRALYSLPILGVKVHGLLSDLSNLKCGADENEFYNSKDELIETICRYIIEELNRQQISKSKLVFLLDHINGILLQINNEELRNYNSKDLS